MFCYQCEQASNSKACTKMGVCGKDPELSALQDLLIYSLKGLSLQAVEARSQLRCQILQRHNFREPTSAGRMGFPGQ